MTRKLTANERTHGARAYSHNASRRAHQLSGPRRERVVCGPQGEPALNIAPPDDAEANWEAACDGCGYLECACGRMLVHEDGYAPTPPPAPVVAGPRPSPAPVVERQAHVWAAGQWARCVQSKLGQLTVGKLYVVTSVGTDCGLWLRVVGDGGGDPRGWHVSLFEPSEPLTSERGAQESDGWTPPSGWTFSKPFEGRVQWTYETGAAAWMLDSTPTWFWAKEDQDFAEHGDRCATLAQACAAALSIELYVVCGDEWRACPSDGVGGVLAHGCTDPESCARAAVEAWSAMQREGA